MKPNIFKIATSELSQDALITWLLQWGDKKYEPIDKNLHFCATRFIQALINEKENYIINSVEAGRQWNNIDVWAKINNEYFIVIEDKKGTKEHSNQLMEYAKKAKEHNKDMNIVLVYFKMEEQSDYSEVDKAGFYAFGREQMLPLLEKNYINSCTNSKSEILTDYYLYIKDLDSQINSFKTLPLLDWHWYSWKGFFSNIQKQVGGTWDYVPNASGGFLGLWWKWIYSELDEKGFHFYLQLEYDKLIFKLHVHEDEHRHEVRDYYRSRLYSLAKSQNINIHQYGRLGTYMGVAKLIGDYRVTGEDNTIDMIATVNNLKTIEKFIELVEAELN